MPIQPACNSHMPGTGPGKTISTGIPSHLPSEIDGGGSAAHPGVGWVPHGACSLLRQLPFSQMPDASAVVMIVMVVVVTVVMLTVHGISG
jgi:hypothetical protein